MRSWSHRQAKAVDPGEGLSVRTAREPIQIVVCDEDAHHSFRGETARPAATSGARSQQAPLSCCPAISEPARRPSFAVSPKDSASTRRGQQPHLHADPGVSRRSAAAFSRRSVSLEGHRSRRSRARRIDPERWCDGDRMARPSATSLRGCDHRPPHARRRVDPHDSHLLAAVGGQGGSFQLGCQIRVALCLL